MPSPPLSLLERLRRPGESGRDADAWSRFVDLYAPLLFYWARRLGLAEPDAADLVQDVFLVLVRQLPTFRHDGRHSFRAWLHTILLNHWRDRLRRPAVVATGAGPRPPARAPPAAERAAARNRQR